MDENPYDSPRAPAQTSPTNATHFGFGNLLFFVLGTVFVAPPIAMLAWALGDSRTIPLSSGISIAIAVLFGIFLIAHSVVRSKVTISVISFVLVIIATATAAAIILF